MPFVNSSMRSAFSRMSSKRWIGSLEGTDGLGSNTPLHARFQRPFFDQFDWPPKHLGDLSLDADHVQK